MFTGNANPRRTFESMERSETAERLGLSVPYEWWPAAPMLKEFEAAGFGWIQIPSPPDSVLIDPRAASKHAVATRAALDVTALKTMVHAPGALRAGSSATADRVLEGVISYAADIGAPLVVYHAANVPDDRAGEDAIEAETRALTAIAGLAEQLGVTIALENLAPVFPGVEALSFTPRVVRSMAKRIGSPAVGVCLDIGHAHLVASLRSTDVIDLIAPALDEAVAFHVHDNFGSRRTAGPRPDLDPIRLDLHLPPGRGTAPWHRIAPMLRRTEAPLLLEVHPPRQAPSRLHAEARNVLFPKAVAAA